MKKHIAKITLTLTMTAALPLLCGTAHATHKNWVLKDSGNHCNFVVPDYMFDSMGAEALNAGQDGRFLECPVSLAGRWGASAPAAFGVPRWANAMWGNVYVETYSDTANVWCQATATMASGSQYWGASTGTFGQHGSLRLEVNSNNWWGGDLQTHQAETVKALVYECQLPSFATVQGYKVKICQRASTCTDANSNDGGVDARESTSLIQTSGFDCTGQTHNYSRGLNGITNTDAFHTSIACPLIPPADDSYEHGRRISKTRVYYTGGSRGAGCVAAGTCPSCTMAWFDRFSTGLQSSTTPFAYTTDLFGRTFLEQPPTDPSSLGVEVNTVVWCYTPPGVTINGVTSSFSTTRNSGGI